MKKITTIILFEILFFMSTHARGQLNDQLSTQQIFNPIQSEFDPNFESADSEEILPVWSPEIKAKFSLVRVKIFPHNSMYNSPHGKDSTINKLTVSSTGDCKIYKSEYDSSAKGISRKTLLDSGKIFALSTDTLKDPIWIECASAIELKRADFSSNPTRYQGLLFVKKINIENPYLTVVNVLPFEQYLKGVVPSEMPASWSSEALKAQAIAARTYAYYELIADVASRDDKLLIEASGAQIDDTVTYQAYLGLKNGTSFTDHAVDITTGLVMTYKNRVIKAFFHADSGGHTENAENVWGVYYPYILGKAEIYAEGAVPGSNWSFTVKLKDAETKLINAGFLVKGDELGSLEINFEDILPSKRPKNIELRLADGQIKKISAVDYSYLTKIKSSWVSFSQTKDPLSVVVNGKGFGHGAGMNQWGARIMVDSLKKSYDEVLKFYYTDIQIVK